MIVPNLVVADMQRSVAFYRDILGMVLSMAVTARRDVLTEGDGADAVFVTLEWDGAQLMLQTRASLAEELPEFRAARVVQPAGTINFRGLDPDVIARKAPADRIVRGPVTQWYGMREVYVRDPDGHIICAGRQVEAG